jgi:hypothetical protein
MASPFEACRTIPAWTVAERAGLQPKRQGSRSFCSCPLHVDKTPSLMLDEKGGWHCFSCGRGGDAVALYTVLYRVPPVEAALKLCGTYGLPAAGNHAPPVKTPEVALRERVECWKKDWWNFLCEIKHLANLVLSLKNIGWDDSLFIWAIEAREMAENSLNLLQRAAPEELVRMAAIVGRVAFE